MTIRSNCGLCLSLLLIVVTPDLSLAFHHCQHFSAGQNRISISHAKRSSVNVDVRPNHDHPSFAFRRMTLTTGSNTPRGTQLSAIIHSEEERHDENASIQTSTTAAWIFGILPALSLVFPLLLQANLLIPSFIAKRIYIYLLAITVMIVASRRGAAEDSPLLGTRVVDLTRDVVPSSSLLQQLAATELLLLLLLMATSELLLLLL